MTAAVLGLDVSPLRLGWGLVRLDDGTAIACGVERIDLPHKGWMETQITEALKGIFFDHDGTRWTTPNGINIAAVYIEQPALPPVSGTKSAFNAGRAIQASHSVVREKWPEAPVEYLMPSEWRKLAGLPGNASKSDVQAKAGLLLLDIGRDDGCPPQDACDALCVALAGQRRNVEVYDRAVETGRA